MQVHRSQPGAEQPLGLPTRNDLFQYPDHPAIALWHGLDLLEVFGAVDVLVHHQPHQFGMARVVMHIVFDQAAQRVGGVAAVDIDLALALAHPLVGAFQNGAVQFVLALEIIVDLALGRLAADLVDPRPGQPLLDEFVGRKIDDLVDRLLAALGAAAARGLFGKRRFGVFGSGQVGNLRELTQRATHRMMLRPCCA